LSRNEASISGWKHNNEAVESTCGKGDNMKRLIQNTLEINHRIAPRLAAIDIKRYLHFDPVRRLAAEGFIERLYKQ
jgi:hypothetical protein